MNYEFSAKLNELQILTSRLQQPDTNIKYLEVEIAQVHDDIRITEMRKERVIKRFSLLREHLTLKISNVHKQLKECLAAKTSYDRFVYTDLNVVEMTSYGLCVFFSISKVVREAQQK